MRLPFRGTIKGALIAAVIAVSPNAYASESELRSAYSAYQEAASAGDLRAALPHAQRAYEQGLELYGPESRNTGLLAFNLGYIENELLDYETAIIVLSTGLTALESDVGTESPELLDTLMELGRAQLGYYDAVSAYETLSRVLSISATTYGRDSVQVGQAHLLLSYAPLFYETDDQRSPFHVGGIDLAPEALYFASNRWAPVGSHIHHRRRWSPDFTFEPNQFQDVGRDHLNAAIAIFRTEEGQERNLAAAHLVEAAFALQNGGRSHVDGLYRDAIDDLIELRYGDEFLVRLVIPWINARHGSGWNLNTIAENVDRVGRLAYLRQEGEIVHLYRAYPVYPRRALLRSEEMQVCLAFTVTRDGSADDIEIYSPEDAGDFGDATREALSHNVYAPRMMNGEPVDRPGVRYCFDFRMR